MARAWRSAHHLCVDDDDDDDCEDDFNDPSQEGRHHYHEYRDDDDDDDDDENDDDSDDCNDDFNDPSHEGRNIMMMKNSNTNSSWSVRKMATLAQVGDRLLFWLTNFESCDSYLGFHFDIVSITIYHHRQGWMFCVAI